ALEVPPRSERDPRPPRVVRSSKSEDPSLLGRLEIGADEALDSLEETHTLVLTLRAGSLRLRRATVERLTRLLAEGRITSDRAMQIEAELAALRDGSLEYELRRALAAFRNTQSRRVMDEETETFERVVQSLGRAIEGFWQGERASEPVTELSAEHRAMLLLRLRDAPETVARHVGAVIEGDDGVVSVDARRGLLDSLRHCADRRLVPSLIAVVEAGAPEVALPAARV